MTPTSRTRASPRNFYSPTIHEGMIIVRRPANNNETAIFWASDYFIPSGASQPRDMDYEAFLDDLQAHMQYDSEHEEIHFRVPVAYQRRSLDPALPGFREMQNVRPVTCIVREHRQWVSALVAMQNSRLLQQSTIEYVIRDGTITCSVSHRFHPVAAAQFSLVRISDAGNSNSNPERDDSHPSVSDMGGFI